MRLVFLGTGDFATPALHALVQSGHAIVAAISQPDRPAGRGRAIQPTPVHAAADTLGIRHVQAEDVNNAPTADLCPEVELGIVAAFGQKLSPELLRAVPRGFINIHASLLPRYRGAAPYQWAVINGDPETGVTVFQLNDRWDAGDIWHQRATPIGATETADELHDRLAALGAELIVETLADLTTSRLKPKPQEPAVASRAPKLSKADGVVDWQQSAARVARRINGLWSWPGAACTLASRSGKRERVLLARADVADPAAMPSEIAAPGAFCDDGTVQASPGRVRLLEVRPASGRLMPFADFANGRHVAPPDRLLPPETP